MAESAGNTLPTQADMEALDAIVQQANAGDRNALAKLRDFLDRNPQIWQRVGDLAQVAERAWIALASNGDSLAAEAMQRKLAGVKRELLDGSDSVVEQMLADTVIATWIELHHLRSIDAGSRERSVTQASLMAKRLESAQRRHTNALKQLVQIRKLLPGGKAPIFKVFPADERIA